MAADGSDHRPALPHIVLALADDLGHNGIGLRNPRLKTPALDRLAKAGVVLEEFYTAPTCAPARASLLTSRWSFKALSGNNAYFWVEEGVHEEYAALLPAALSRRGYVTRMVGKWHAGHYRRSLLPTSRGFGSFFGFLSGCEDHLTQENCCRRCPQTTVIDLFRDDRPARGENGSDNSAAFAREACRIVRDHAAAHGPLAGRRRRPLFLYYALQDVHSPFQVQPRYEALYSSSVRQFNVWAGMVSAVDEAVHNVSLELRRAGMWRTTLFVLMGDNGSPVGCGPEWCAGSNAPLKGGKNTLWEGGVRAPAILSGGWLPSRQHGKHLWGLAHMVDVGPTLCALSGGPCTAMEEGPSSVDGLDLSRWLSGDAESSPRAHVVLEHTLVAAAGRRRKRRRPPESPLFANSTGGVRVGDWKLIVGGQQYEGHYGDFSPNGTDLAVDERRGATPSSCRARPCLFNVRDDPTERDDLASTRKDKLDELGAAFRALEHLFHAPRPTVSSRELYCAAAAASGGFMVPWRS